MNVVARLRGWLRWSFSGTNTLESWRERAVLAGLLALAVFLGWLLGQVPEDSTLLAWLVFAGLAVVVVILLGPAGFRVFSPILVYEMIRSARRSRYFFLRMLYAGLLLFIFLSIFSSSPGRLSDRGYASVAAANFFEAFMIVQLVAVGILTPAYVAGAIAEEKERRTMEYLLTTDLSNREIVLSKLLARLLYLSLFLITGLPILGIVQFLGGVDPDLVLAGFAATGLTLFAIGGIGIFNSVVFKRPRDAITLTYLCVLAYYALSAVAYALIFSPWGPVDLTPWEGLLTVADVGRFLSRGNIFILISELSRAGARGGGINLVLPGLLQSYAWFMLGVGCVTIVYATLRVRLVALRQAYGRSRRVRRAFARPEVGEMPMLWKEMHVEGGRLTWLTVIIFLVLIGVTLAPGGIMMYFWMTEDRFDRYAQEGFNAYVRTASTGILCLYWLAVAIRASTAFSSERDRKTLDDLLTAPLEGNTILWGKFWGAVLSIRMGWVWPASVWLIGLITGGLHPAALPLLLAAWFIFACFFAMLGLFFSMTARTSLRASVYTLLCTFGIWGGHWLIWICCAPLLFASGGGRGAEVILKLHAGVTPPAVLGILPFCESNFEHDWSEFGSLIGFSLLGLALWTCATVAFWAGAVVPRFQAFANRAEAGMAPEGRGPRPRRDGPRRDGREPARQPR